MGVNRMKVKIHRNFLVLDVKHQTRRHFLTKWNVTNKLKIIHLPPCRLELEPRRLSVGLDPRTPSPRESFRFSTQNHRKLN